MGVDTAVFHSGFDAPTRRWVAATTIHNSVAVVRVGVVTNGHIVGDHLDHLLTAPLEVQAPDLVPAVLLNSCVLVLEVSLKSGLNMERERNRESE